MDIPTKKSFLKSGIVLFLYLTSAIYCSAEIQDKSKTEHSDYAGNTSKTNDLPIQYEDSSNTTPPSVKAYKTLNFGEDLETVNRKIVEIVKGEYKGGYSCNPYPRAAIFWRSLFETDVLYKAYRPTPFTENTPDEKKDYQENLRIYFSNKVTTSARMNEVVSVQCFIFNDKINDKSEQGNGLALVEVTYLAFDEEKLIDAFKQNYPNASKEIISSKEEIGGTYVGVFLEGESLVYTDSTHERKATLSITKLKPTVTFSETCTLPQSLRTDLLERMKKPQVSATALFVFKPIFEFHKNSFFQLIEANGQKFKAKIRENTGF